MFDCRIVAADHHVKQSLPRKMPSRSSSDMCLEFWDGSSVLLTNFSNFDSICLDTIEASSSEIAVNVFRLGFLALSDLAAVRLVLIWFRSILTAVMITEIHQSAPTFNLPGGFNVLMQCSAWSLSLVCSCSALCIDTCRSLAGQHYVFFPR